MSSTFFGTDGIRGKANEFPLIPEFVSKLARALCEVLEIGEDNNVVIGLDTRVSGVMLEASMTAAFLAEGVAVHHLGVVSTPATAHLTKNSNASAGIMITASHNPYEDNGVKVFTKDGYKLSAEQEKKIEAIIVDEDSTISFGKVGLSLNVESPESLYYEQLNQIVEGVKFEGLKVVLDCAHGATSFSAPFYLESLGLEVIPYAVEPNGTNINDTCGAVYPEKTAALVLENKADLGICFDGDGDRLILVDETGTVVDGDCIICLVAKALHHKGELKNSTVVATVMSNLGLRDTLKAEGVELEITDVGDKNVVDRMRAGDYSLGGENSGHIVFSQYGTTGDGLMSALIVLCEMIRSQKTLSKLAGVMKKYPQKLTSIKVREKPKIEKVPQLHSAIKEAEQALGTEGRILVRYSGTEPKIRILVEAKEETKVMLWSKHLKNIVQKTIGCVL